MNRLQKSFSQCKICLAPAIHSNYGVISCSPCKMFFKRNAEIEQVRRKKNSIILYFSRDLFRINSNVISMVNVKLILTIDICVHVVDLKNVLQVE